MAEDSTMRKLSNDELATRTREANRRRGERQRERLTIAGRAALTVWLPVRLRKEFSNAALSAGLTISELAERLIEKGLKDKDIAHCPALKPLNADMDTADMFAMPDTNSTDTKENAPADLLSVSVGTGSDRDAMLQQVGELLAEGLTGADIARKLTAAGYRSQQGTELRGANVLREYRTWKEKNCGSDSTAV
jgi:hypothetical protein